MQFWQVTGCFKEKKQGANMDITSLRKDCGALRYLVCNVVFYYKNNSRYINIVMDQVLEVPWKNEPKGKFKNIFEIPALSNSQSRNPDREN